MSQHGSHADPSGSAAGVRGFHTVPAETLSSQIDCVLGDIGADVVKTGMLPSAEVSRPSFILEATSGLLPGHNIALYGCHILLRVESGVNCLPLPPTLPARKYKKRFSHTNPTPPARKYNKRFSHADLTPWALSHFLCDPCRWSEWLQSSARQTGSQILLWTLSWCLPVATAWATQRSPLPSKRGVSAFIAASCLLEGSYGVFKRGWREGSQHPEAHVCQTIYSSLSGGAGAYMMQTACNVTFRHEQDGEGFAEMQALCAGCSLWRQSSPQTSLRQRRCSTTAR